MRIGWTEGQSVDNLEVRTHEPIHEGLEALTSLLDNQFPLAVSIDLPWCPNCGVQLDPDGATLKAIRPEQWELSDK